MPTPDDTVEGMVSLIEKGIREGFGLLNRLLPDRDTAEVPNSTVCCMKPLDFGQAVALVLRSDFRPAIPPVRGDLVGSDLWTNWGTVENRILLNNGTIYVFSTHAMACSFQPTSLGFLCDEIAKGWKPIWLDAGILSDPIGASINSLMKLVEFHTKAPFLYPIRELKSKYEANGPGTKPENFDQINWGDPPPTWKQVHYANDLGAKLVEGMTKLSIGEAINAAKNRSRIHATK